MKRIASEKQKPVDSAIRYEPTERILRLVRALSVSRIGLTLDDMAAEVGRSRRTVERLRDRIQDVFPQLTFVDDEDRVRRWRLPANTLIGTLQPKTEAIVAVETAARDLANRGDADRAALLRDAALLLRAAMPSDAQRRADPDIAALMESEGIAMRPGPRAVMIDGLLPILRNAILAVACIEIHYEKRAGQEQVTHVVCPYGILYGGRGWLVAHVDGMPDMRLWRLDRIRKATLLDRSYARQETFSLAEYSARSFGTFQEEPIDVVLHFAPSAAADAARWAFHPSQAIEHQSDGSLLVRFRAGGQLEMRHHLFTWGTTVTVLEPADLKDALVRDAQALVEHYRTIGNPILSQQKARPSFLKKS